MASGPPTDTAAAEMGVTADSPWLDDIEARSNLTRSQYLIWAGQKLSPGDPLYNMIFAVRLRGPLQRAAFTAAWRSLVDDNAMMRAVIEERDGVPWRTIRDAGGPALEHVDLTGHADPDRACAEWIETHRTRSFDLERQLVHSALLTLGAEDHVWYLNQHHVVTDAFSVTLLRSRLAARYAALLSGDPPPHQQEAGYDDYAETERASRATKKRAAQRDYWRAGLPADSDDLRFYGRRREGEGGRTERVALRLDTERATRLRRLAREAPFRALSDDLSLANLLFAATAALVSRLTGIRDLSIGMPIHNRARRSDRETMGLFMEILPLFVDIERDETLASLGRKIHAGSLATLGHSAAGLSTPRSNDVYDVVLNVLPMQMAGFEGLRSHTEWVHSGHGDPHHTLRIQVHDFEAGGALHFDVDFDVEMFPPAYRRLALEHFERIIDAMLTDLEQPLAAVALSSGEERREHVEAFNDTARVVAGASVDTRIRACAQTTPETPAVSCGDQSLSYRTLDRDADRLAGRLMEKGVRPGQLVPLLCERTPNAIIAILAVLRAGAAYVPLEPRHPQARLQAICADIRASGRASGFLLIDRADLRCDGLEPLLVPDELRDADSAESIALPEIGADDLAYVIYTSGSTGQPKGTLIRHGALLNYVDWAARHYAAGPGSRYALHSSLAVDLTVTSVFVPLTVGGCIVAYPDHGPNDLPILRVFEEDAVDVLKLTPAHLALLGELDGRCRNIRTLILGGEDLKTELVRSVAGQFPDAATFFNEYGPTEATVGCMIHRFDPAQDTGVSVPIGRPIDNARVYVLDEDLRPLATGLVGEMCIGGAGIAAGYLSHPSGADGPFVPDPFAAGATLYRTGDLGRWDTEGRLEFLGRADTQVKIRGARVELGEVEAALVAYPTITAATVLPEHVTAGAAQAGSDAGAGTGPAPESESVRLNAFFVADEAPAEEALRAHLASLLPEEMRPAGLIRLDALPLTTAGKVDLKALAKAAHAPPDAGGEEAPLTETERTLMALWCELLDLPSVGRNDSFFDLGGSSLAVLQLGARIRSSFGVELPLERLFGGPTVAELGAIIEALIIEQIEAMSDEQAESLARDLG